MPEAPVTPARSRMSRARVFQSAVFILVLVVLYFAIRIIFPAPSAPMSTQATIQEPTIPNAPTATAADHVAAQETFQYLVSYTDRGFSPSALRMKKGETVRFTNNAATRLKLTIASDAVRDLVPGAYIQYTAGIAGNIPYSDGIIEGALIVTQ